jgi:DNA-directed RNA polymerase specialized sigma24 family protein
MTFEEAYRKYYGFVVKNFSKYPKEQAEEYAQDVFVAVHNNFHKYDPKHKMTSFLVSYVINIKYDISQYENAKDRKVANITYDDQEMARIADQSSAERFESFEQHIDAAIIIKSSPLSKIEKTILISMLQNKPLKNISVEIGKNYDYTKLHSREALRKISRLGA